MIVKKLTDREWPEGQVTDCYVVDENGKVWPDLVYEERQRLSSEPDDSRPRRTGPERPLDDRPESP